MAIQILPILRNLAPLVASASGIVANLKSNPSTADVDAKVARLEAEAVEVSEVLSAAVVQLEALAEQFKAQSEINQELERAVTRAKWVSGVALFVALAAVISVIVIL